MPKKTSSAVDKEEAKANAAAEAAAKRLKSKQGKDVTKYYAGVATAVGVCILAVVIIASKPSSGKKDGDAKLKEYVNDYYAMRDVTSAANGNFTAAASSFFNRWTHGDAKYGLAGITVSNMLGISGAVQSCDKDQATESGALPPSYDARDNWAGCFSDAYDSGNCSASYAIAAADVLSTRFCIADNAKYASLRLSSQQILSCDKKSQGCKGGGIDNVWAYMQRRGLYPEKCVPYVGAKGAKCATECAESDKLRVLDHCILSGEKAIKREIYNRGPVVAPVYLKSDYLVYGSGVYVPTEDSKQVYDKDGHPIQHAVSVLGWGKSQGTPYWIVKHSWGAGWGENGYARVAIDTVLREGYVVVGIPATDEAIKAAELKKVEEEQAKEERKKERAARDERIRENRKKMEAEKSASEDATNLDKANDDKDDKDGETEVEIN